MHSCARERLHLGQPTAARNEHVDHVAKAAMSRCRPILDAQTRDAFELAGVGGDNDQPPGARLAGDEQVVAADRQTHRRQLGAEPPRLARVVEIEIKHRERERIDLREIMLDPGRTVRAPVEFVEDHCRYRHIFGRLPAQPLRDSAAGIAQHSNDRVGVEREGHAASNSTRGCGGG